MERSNGLLSKIGNSVMIAATAASLGGCGNEGLDAAKQNTQRTNVIEKKLSKIELDNEKTKDAIISIARGINDLLERPVRHRDLPSKRSVPSLPTPLSNTHEKGKQTLELLNHEKRIRVLEKVIENLKAINKEQSKKLADTDSQLKELNALKRKIEAVGLFDVQRSR